MKIEKKMKIFAIKYFNKKTYRNVEKNIVAYDEDEAFNMIEDECPYDLRLQQQGDSLEDSLVMSEL